MVAVKNSEKFLDVKVDGDWSVADQVSYAAHEFKKWVEGLPKHYRTALTRVQHHGGYVLFRYEAVDAKV